jgi:hypothetical protein
MRKPPEFFNQHLDADIVAVLDASAALEVTEFRLFQMAFRDWYGKSPRNEFLERQFAAYMFAQRVPAWVRQFARKILKLQAQGRLDPRSFGVWKRLPSSRMVMIAKIYTAVLLLIFSLSLLSIYTLPESILAMVAGCYFPPCY